jgi:hypothetical protein
MAKHSSEKCCESLFVKGALSLVGVELMGCGTASRKILAWRKTLVLSL